MYTRKERNTVSSIFQPQKPQALASHCCRSSVPNPRNLLVIAVGLPSHNNYIYCFHLQKLVNQASSLFLLLSVVYVCMNGPLSRQAVDLCMCTCMHLCVHVLCCTFMCACTAIHVCVCVCVCKPVCGVGNAKG